ncbi:MAG: methylated-DNA--[protein]-cysteine S-methyltransferase [Lentisphaeria bacterium]|nr:methylated-DNA--[protein]-cysteine S-methyltransferase [Lentisphaeria bacterium]
MRWTADYVSPVGRLQLEADEDALLAVRFDFAAAAATAGTNAVLGRAAAWLDRYFAGEAVSPRELPLRIAGSPFRRTILQLLMEVPYGHSITYGELAAAYARRVGIPRMSAQAAGGAVGANSLPIIIPCHRVLAAGGRLGGFSCGLAVKRRLLALERISYRE